MKRNLIQRITLFVALFLFTISGAFASGTYESVEINDTIGGDEIYPGTVRSYSVWMPRQYDATKPACLLLCLDGDIYDIKADVEQMIDDGRMPLVVCIFLQPGVVRDNEGNVIRYNRSNEFDAIDGRFAEYIEKILFPRISQLTAPDGRKVFLSNNPEDRCTIGASSGGIASFVLAWNRPDLFRRVYSSVGTYVAMRGGNELPALVRKTEPKPIRIFIHDGRNDVWNPIFGHWFEYNRIMESALRFAGYDVMHVWDETSHSIKGGKREFIAAMEWLWRDYPHSLRPMRTQNELLSTLLINGEDWIVAPSEIEFPQHNECILSDGRRFSCASDCSIAVSPDNHLLVKASCNSDWLESYIVSDDSIINGQRFYWLHNTTHQSASLPPLLQFDSVGYLYAATGSGLQICDHNGRVRGILAYPSHTTPEAMLITDGIIYLKIMGIAYARRLNVKGYLLPQPPYRYKSQGQG